MFVQTKLMHYLCNDNSKDWLWGREPHSFVNLCTVIQFSKKAEPP